MTHIKLFVRGVNLVLICFFFYLMGQISIKPKEVEKVVFKEATDEQIIQYWFGNVDKTALRKRVCGK